METQIMIYGANGYTGTLIARHCREKGILALLAGRTESSLKKLAGELGMPYVVLDLKAKSEKWKEQLARVKMVLNCAGPFIHTYKRIARLCIDTGIHYLDITGEIPVFEGLAQMGKSASAAGVMLMPGVGFDVVPSDCMAAHLHHLMPDATHLEMAFYSEGGGVSHGTMNTVIENLGTGGAIRQDGKITPVPSAWKTREIDFGPKKRMAATIPWGDVSTAYYTTGIPNIMVYLAMAPAAIKSAARMDRWGWLLKLPILKKILKFLNKRRAPGPNPDQNLKGRTYLWGEVRNGQQTITARLETPEGYRLTALTAILIASKVLDGQYKPGFFTPAGLFGEQLILEAEGVKNWS